MGAWAYGRVGVVMAVGLALLGGCGGPVTPPPKPALPPKAQKDKKPKEIPGMSLTEGEISASAPDGRPLWKATGKTIKTDEEKGIALFTQGSCQLFDKGVMTLRFQADTIEVHYDAQPPTMSLKGNVVAQSPKEGWSFRAPQVRAVCDNNKRFEKVIAEQGVRLEKANLKIQAAKMTTDVQLKRMTMEDAHGTLELPSLSAKRSR